MDLLRTALEYDSSYAQVYVELGKIYRTRHFWKDFLSEDYLDSVLYFANEALMYDKDLADAHRLKGQYYDSNADDEMATRSYLKAIALNPNDWRAYTNLSDIELDLVEAIRYQREALLRCKDENLWGLLIDLGLKMFMAGFPDQMKQYLDEAFHLHRDTAYHLVYEFILHYTSGDYKKSIETFERAISIDSSSIYNFSYDFYIRAGSYQKAYEFYKILFDSDDEDLRMIYNLHCSNDMAFACKMIGKEEEAQYWFDQQIYHALESIKRDRYYSRRRWAQIDLAGTYTILGNKDKAYHYLQQVGTLEDANYFMLSNLRFDPLLNGLREDAEFQEIFSEFEARYQKEHERVKNWLKENDML
jgi:tetratricopeptide (TPR) repeat protein